MRLEKIEVGRWMIWMTFFLIFSLNTSCTKFKNGKLLIKSHEVHVDIADEEKTWLKGLTGRKEMAVDSGMLFIFPDNRKLGFWSKGTLMSVSVAFLDKNGKIENICEMEANSMLHYYSDREARYALIMNSKWFSNTGVNVGDVIGDVLKCE